MSNITDVLFYKCNKTQNVLKIQFSSVAHWTELRSTIVETVLPLGVHRFSRFGRAWRVYKKKKNTTKRGNSSNSVVLVKIETITFCFPSSYVKSNSTALMVACTLQVEIHRRVTSGRDFIVWLCLCTFIFLFHSKIL